MTNDKLNYSFIEQIENPACIKENGFLVCKNRAFFNAELSGNEDPALKVYAGGNIYRIKVIELRNGAKLFVYQNITRTEELTNENERFRRELELARDIQSSMLLTHLPDIRGYRFEALYMPSTIVGGDLFDAVEIGGGKVFLYVADVAGHGIAAAMLTVFFKQQISIYLTRPDAGLEGLVDFLNLRLSQLNCEKKFYLTLFAAILDTHTGELTCLNAGHSAIPLVLRNDGSVEELYLPGTPVCTWNIVRNNPIKTTKLEKGGRLLLYTDGVLPADNYENAYAALKECLSMRELNSKGFMEAVRTSFISEPEDDVLMILCERE